MVDAEGNGCHGHAVAADHPVLMRQHIFLPDGLQPLCRGKEPVNGHKHEQRPFPETALGKKTHVQPRGSTQHQYHQHVYLTHPDVDVLSLFQYIGGELRKRRHNTEHARENVQVKTILVHRLQEQEGPFFNKPEIAAERKIGQRIFNQQQAEKSNGYPEQGGEKITCSTPEGGVSAVRHGSWLSTGMKRPGGLHKKCC